ncbi:hypothetical protein COCNU_01G006370 [Cocos nucifera]|uniref:Uncharacterized protein n=1 Tax=Cocos nucifera TaxID=13894 RepID=A0A8K0HV29_COCNU|nr:hypothetical protein COCNU_01G006370 [Cocos nucifera]
MKKGLPPSSSPSIRQHFWLGLLLCYSTLAALFVSNVGWIGRKRDWWTVEQYGFNNERMGEVEKGEKVPAALGEF